MAFPFIFHENFEAGTLGGFTSEVDTSGRLDFPDHNDKLEITPWRGQYAMRVDLNRGTTIAYVENNVVLNMIAAETRYIRFMLRTSSDFRVPPGQAMKFFTVYSGFEPDPVIEEFSVGFARIETQINSVRMSIHSPDDGEYIDGLNFPIGRWFSVQITIHNSTTAGRVYLHVGDNTLQAFRLVFQPFSRFRVGSIVQSPDIRGTLYFDDILIDNAKLEDPTYIDPDKLGGESLLYTKTSYLFVGEGIIRGATLISGGTDNTALFYDTDRLPVVHHDVKAALRCARAESKDTLIEGVRFKRGCYLVLSGTNPQALVHFGAVGPTPAELDNKAA